MQLNCAGKNLDLTRPQVMGILNVTPDSFSDGGAFLTLETARAQAHRMIDEGAAIIDVGGESTRPGAAVVSVQQELDRVIPVIEALVRDHDVVISIDTSKPQVMQAAIYAGARMINDVTALRADHAIETAKRLMVPVILMHMQGQPGTMQQAPQYDNVVIEVAEFLRQRCDSCIAAGIDVNQIVIDPGFGFGKSLEHNLQLFASLNTFVELGYPVLVGVSRKSMMGTLLGLPVEQRISPSIALAGLAVWLGARIIRAHDVAATRQAIDMIYAVETVARV